MKRDMKKVAAAASLAGNTSLSSQLAKDITYRVVLAAYMIFIHASLASFMRSYPHASCAS